MCVFVRVKLEERRRKKLGEEKAERWLLHHHIIQKLISEGYQSHFRDGERRNKIAFKSYRAAPPDSADWDASHPN